jgi:hypothetical protein
MNKSLLQTFILSLAVTFCFANNSNLKISLQNPCDAAITPGEIGYDQIVCEDDNTPLKLEELAAPTGYPDGYEFLWIYTNTNPNAQTIVWYPINAATNKSYQPEPLTATTWFRRCVRPVGCDIYTGESNIIKLELEDCVIDCSLFTSNIIVQEEITCFGDSDGQIQVETDGGLAPYTYEWSHSTIQSDLAEDLAKGTYAVTVTDANDCTAVSAVSLNSPNAFSVSYDISPETCVGEDGAIYVQVSGGIQPYTFLWGNGFGTNQNLENVPAGYYVVWIQDANGCKTATEMTVTKECDPLIIDFDNKALQTVENELITIQWTSINEQEGGTYLVERSRNNIDFNLLCSMTGAGFETLGHTYICHDQDPFAGTSFYRIVYVNPDLGKTISESQSIFIENEGSSKILIYPNPVVNTASVNFLKPLDSPTPIKIFNKNGNQIQFVIAQSGKTIQNLDLSNFPSGQYLIYVEMESQKSEVHQVLKSE